MPSITKRPRSVGVVIGVEQYKDIAPAPFAANDPLSWNNILKISWVLTGHSIEK